MPGTEHTGFRQQKSDERGGFQMSHRRDSCRGASVRRGLERDGYLCNSSFLSVLDCFRLFMSIYSLQVLCVDSMLSVQSRSANMGNGFASLQLQMAGDSHTFFGTLPAKLEVENAII